MVHNFENRIKNQKKLNQIASKRKELDQQHDTFIRTVIEKDEAAQRRKEELERNRKEETEKRGAALSNKQKEKENCYLPN